MCDLSRKSLLHWFGLTLYNMIYKLTNKKKYPYYYYYYYYYYPT